MQKKKSQSCFGLETAMSWEPWLLPLSGTKPRLSLGGAWDFHSGEGRSSQLLLQHLPPSLIPSGANQGASQGVLQGSRRKAGCSSPFLVLVPITLHMEIWLRPNIAEWVGPFLTHLTGVRHICLVPHSKLDYVRLPFSKLQALAVTKNVIWSPLQILLLCSLLKGYLLCLSHINKVWISPKAPSTCRILRPTLPNSAVAISGEKIRNLYLGWLIKAQTRHRKTHTTDF